MRVRGLKRGSVIRVRIDETVAPHAGAWIETLKLKGLDATGAVAPHAGAWIETLICPRNARTRKQSHPMRVRGLKQGDNRGGVAAYCRTPCGCVD